MYELLKRLALAILRVPPEPEDPMGAVDTLVVFRASPNFFKYRLLVWIIKTVLGALGYVLVFGLILVEMLGKIKKSGSAPLLILLALAAIMLFAYAVHVFASYVVLRLDYEMRWYKVSDRSLRIREGVLQVREITMTFANIQNISVTQGPIQRIFGIADLKVETAGGGGARPAKDDKSQGTFSDHTAFFRGVDNVEEIKTLMLERLKKYRDSGLGDTDEPLAPEQTRCDSSVTATLEAIRDEAVALRTAAENLGSTTELTSA